MIPVSELTVAWDNTTALMARGTVEFGPSHYPVMVLMHASWVEVLYSALNVAMLWVRMRAENAAYSDAAA